MELKHFGEPPSPMERRPVWMSGSKHCVVLSENGGLSFRLNFKVEVYGGDVAVT